MITKRGSLHIDEHGRVSSSGYRLDQTEGGTYCTAQNEIIYQAIVTLRECIRRGPSSLVPPNVELTGPGKKTHE